MDELDIWDPFKRMRKQESSLSKFFDSTSSIESDLMIRQPLIDIKEDKSNFKVRAELPGLKKQNLDIDLTENQLTLKGKMSSKKEEKNSKKGYYFEEKNLY